MDDIIYLDNAATSFPKPDAVYQAVDRYNRELGVAVGRGAFGQALDVQSVVDRCRLRAAELLGAMLEDGIDRDDLDGIMTGQTTFVALVESGMATVEGNPQVLAQLMSMMVTFTPDFEMLPGTKRN